MLPLATIALTGAIVATLVLVASPLIIFLYVCAFVAFVAPGIVIARAALGRASGWLTALVFGPVVGYGASSLALLLLWWAGGRGIWLLAAAPALAALLVWPTRALAGRVVFSTLDRRDVLALVLLLLLVPLVVARPFSRVGEPLPEGKAYRAYFTADYVWRMVVVAELAKGDMPPSNPFFRGDALHYYWLPHLLPAVAYRNLGHLAVLDELLLCQSVLMDLVFVTLLFGFVRQFVRSRRAAALGIAGAVLFTSFEGVYLLWDLWQREAPLALVRNVNVDAVTRWLLHGMPIDGLQRLLWYQPHHACGYGLGLLALLVGTRRRDLRDARVMAAAGVLLGTSLLISTFGALMVTSALALYEMAGVARRRDVPRLIAHGIAGAIPLGAAVAIVLALQYVDHTGEPLVSFMLNPVAAYRPVATILLSFGPMLLVGAAGAVVAWRRGMNEVLPVGALVAVCFLYYFFVDVRDHQDVYVGWRSGHLLFMALAALTAVALEGLWTLPWPRRHLAVTAGAILALAAAPTTIIDFYNTQDIENREMGPTFRWTLLLSHEEQSLLKWLRENTAPDAIVQVDPKARDSDTWAYLPAFAERRMSVGLPISMIPRRKYVVGSDRMHDLFIERDVREAHAAALRNGIDYLVVGAPERRADQGCDDRFSSAPQFFTLEFRASQVSLYKVNR